MSTEKVEVAAAVVAMVGFVVCLVSLRGLIRERDEWRGCAGALAGCVRGLDALPLVEDVRLVGVSHMTWAEGGGTATLPIPPAVAVVGRSAQLDRWSLGAAQALRRYDLLLEPEDGR